MKNKKAMIASALATLTICGAASAASYNAGFYDGEQAVITGMIIETDGDCDSVLIYYNGDCYLHGANGFPIDIDEPLTACYQID